MTLSRYPKYRKSGIEWLGEVPEHWKSVRLGVLFREIDDAGSEELPVLSVSIHDGVSDREFGDDEQDRAVTRSEDRAKYKLVQPGDLVYNMMRAWQGGFGSVTVPGMVSPAYVVARPVTQIRTEFIEQLLRTPQAVEELRRHSHGITDFRLRLYWDEFKSIKIALPSAGEQSGILDCLRPEIVKLDRLIAEQNRLVELLEEVLHCLVLGSRHATNTIEHRLGNASYVVMRPVTQKEGELYRPLGLFNRGRGIFHKEARETSEMGDSDFFWVESGDLIISGQFAWEGAVGLAGGKEHGCVVSHRYPILRGRHGVALTEYLFALLLTKHGDFLLNESSRGAAGRNRPLNIDQLLKESIWLPSIATQRVIAQAVHRRKTLASAIAEQTGLLLERRAALISAAVTGKIDIRGLSAAGPEKAAVA